MFRYSADSAKVYAARRDWKLNQKPVFLLHCDGADESTTFKDSGGTGHTVTANGNAQIDTAQSKFGGASALFDGSGDYLSIPDHANWDFNSGKFAIDFWVRFNSITGKQCFYSQSTGTDYIALFQDFDQGKIYFSVFNTTSLINQSAAWTPSADTWYHVAIIRGWAENANRYAITINGSPLTFGSNTYFDDTDDMPNLAASINIGRMYETAQNDSGNTGHTITFNGNAAFSTGAYKWGDASLLLDGSGDYVSISDHADWDIQTNFTIDMWVNPDTISSWRGFFSQYENYQNFWAFRMDAGKPRFDILSGGSYIVQVVSTTAVSTGSWQHLALCKVGNEYGIYLDGTQIAHTSDADIDTFAGSFHIGALHGSAHFFDGYMDEIRIYHGNPFSASPNSGLTDTITVPTTYHSSDSDTKLLMHCDITPPMKYFKGWIDEFRIVKGKAVWTADFTPPAKPYISWR